MIWFSQQALEKKILNDQLTDKDGLNYFFALFIFTAIPFSLININAMYHLDKLISVIILLIITWGVIFSYRANKRIDNKDFFNRFFSLSWIIGIRMILLLILSLILINFIKDLIPHKYFCKHQRFNIILGVIYIAIVWIINYALIINAFGRIRKKKNYAHHV